MNREPYIQIGDHVLTGAQAMAVRVAVASFRAEVSADDARKELGPIADAYRDRLGEIEAIIMKEAAKLAE